MITSELAIAGAVGIACATSAALTGLYVRWARQRMLDLPTVRSSHTRPTPTGGGVGFLAAFFAVALVFDADARLLLLLAGPLAVIGFLDDRRGMPWWARYGVHLGVAIAAVCVLGPLDAPLVGKDVLGLVLACAISVVGVTGVITAYNFMDGLDGLVGGCSLVQFCFFGLWLDQPIWWLLGAALAGFLLWNWSPARVFMGDTGSTVLGLLFAAAALGPHGAPSWHWYHPLVALPLVGDFIYTTVRRWARGHNVLKPDRCHFYQRIMRAGVAVPRISAAYMGATALVGVLLTRYGERGALMSVGLVLAAFLAAEVFAARRGVPFSVVHEQKS